MIRRLYDAVEQFQMALMPYALSSIYLDKSKTKVEMDRINADGVISLTDSLIGKLQAIREEIDKQGSMRK